ncbi:SDR family oxidoreductase [Reichenbachiella carrageenanivorans]|uniref:SDR family oxidoreductase n=1 Tax=Reichenbachiella carrageenanivorans TaxID=2979869 RepID=A0ABY6D147_9BACT|nr:SDR family oxidoreductase [Reichenbachiella carrageenanivorans]UXX79892.1 SDR family oxidoreductase [Reichenbachiella carrageenanivorans]
MELEFENKVALITGVASGFGAATAKQLAAQGCTIVGVERDETKLNALLTELPTAHTQHHAIVQDLRDTQGAKTVASRAKDLAGRIDIVINSAGVCHFNKLNEITIEEWDEVFEIDVRALFQVAVGAAEIMDHGGIIINLGSNAGRKGRAVSAHYAAAKAGVSNFSESLALAYGAKGIRVNTVSPGPIMTPMWNDLYPELSPITGKNSAELAEAWTAQTPLGRLGKADDVANLIVFLASEKGSFITGQDINVCGGFMLNS